MLILTIMLGLILVVTPGLFAQPRKNVIKLLMFIFLKITTKKPKNGIESSEIDPNFWEARYWLGKTKEQLGKIEEALEEWVVV